MKYSNAENPLRTPLKKDTPIVFHFREHDKNGNMLARGGETIVYYPKQRLFGRAICVPIDNYNKKVGTRLAKNQIETNGDLCYCFNTLKNQDYVTMIDVKYFAELIYQKY